MIKEAWVSRGQRDTTAISVRRSIPSFCEADDAAASPVFTFSPERLTSKTPQLTKSVGQSLADVAWLACLGSPHQNYLFERE
jgi:hypothetical protein